MTHEPETCTDPNCYVMLYCDQLGGCRVNTFECLGKGDCPACGHYGVNL